MGHLDGSEFDLWVVTHVNEPVIKVEGLSYRYPNKTLALDKVSLEIAKGSRVALLGPNGAGKSTLFLHFNGILKPREGKVLFEGKEIKYGAKSLEELRAKVAIVLQNPDDQIFSATVEEDVAFGPMNLGLPMDEVEARVTEALDQVGLLDQRSKPTQQLSFGQRKRVSLAGAIAMRPEVLVMDEPTAGLDPRMVHELLELADELNHKGLTVIMSTHDVECAYSWADEVKVLEKGMMVYSGATPGFFSETGLVHRVGLTEPLLFEMNRSLSAVHGVPEAPHPRNIFELEQKFSLDTDRRSGRLFLMPLDGLSQERLNILRKEMPQVRFGLLGSRARMVGCAKGLDVEVRFDALEKGLAEVSSGRDFVLIADDAWREIVEGRLEADREWYGTKLRPLPLS